MSSGEREAVTPKPNLARSHVMTDLRREVTSLVRARGYERRPEPFKLVSGQLSHDYVDGKYAVDQGKNLRLVCEAVVEAAHGLGVDFTAVGGLTMGADALAHGTAIVAECAWFSVRKEPKPRGRGQRIEGARLGSEDRVLLVDDVVTTGGSILFAYDRVTAEGARVAAAVAMVDRGESAGALFAERRVPYTALVTYDDLGIECVTQPWIKRRYETALEWAKQDEAAEESER